MTPKTLFMDIDKYIFSWKKKQQQLTQQNARQQHAHMTCSVYLHKHDVLTVPLTVLLHYQITRMTCTLPYQCSNQAGDNQSHSIILFQF